MSREWQQLKRPFKHQNQLTKMTLTKRDLVIRISEETEMVQTQVFEVVQKTLNYITEALAKGDKVELRNFGVFDVKIRKARIGRNPNKPETDVPIPARSMVKFKAGKEMRAEVLKLATPNLAPANLVPENLVSAK
jgi:nucleoid DNA-binding protein